jgi:cyclin B
MQLEMMAFFYVELCLVSYEMVKFSPSMLAASAIYTAQNTLKKPKEDCWTPLLKHHSGYSEAQLMYAIPTQYNFTSNIFVMLGCLHTTLMIV